MFLTSMTVLGGDLRQCYLAEYMNTLGHDVICFCTMPFPFSQAGGPVQARYLQEALAESRFIIGPTPFSKDGVHFYQEAAQTPLLLDTLKDALKPGQVVMGGGIPADFAQACKKAGISVWDFLDSQSLARANAAFTAEGLLSFVIAETSFSLQGQRALLLGYGRCGQEIVKLFTKLNLSFAILDRDLERLALAPADSLTLTESELSTLPMEFDLVINTIPARLLTDHRISLLPKHCVLFDIASAPFGFDTKNAGCHKLVRCPGIPGKTMPQTAGEFLGKVIIERILSYGP